MVEIKKWVLEKGKLTCEWGPEEPKEYYPCQDSDGMICPYGSLVEMMPLAKDVKGIERKQICKHYGHLCPYAYYAELII
jgi:hypothetical protein